MKIVVNGESKETNARTLHELCDALGYGDSRIATALNGAFVALDERRQRQLKANDQIEIVAPRQGG